MAYKLYAFGSNSHNQLGLPLGVDHTALPDKITSPTATLQTSKLEVLRSIHGGAKHTLLLTTNGVVLGAGNNQDFQLALNDTAISKDEDNSNAQHQASSGSNSGLEQRLVGFSELYTGISFCATALTSSAYIVNQKTDSGDWQCHIVTTGYCTWGELGSGKAVDHFPTVDPKILPGKAISFAAGTHHYVVVLESGIVYGWGKTRGGQLGSTHQASPLLKPTKLDIYPGLDVDTVVCGNDFTFLCSSTLDDRFLLLGKDKHGIAAGLTSSFQIRSFQAAAVQTPSLSKEAKESVQPPSYMSQQLKPASQASGSSDLPHPPSSIAQWKYVCATWHAVFVLLYDGRLIAAGKQNQWKLAPDNLPPLMEIATGNEHVLARTEDGRLLAWGWGDDGNCGDLSQLDPPATGNFVSGRWNEIRVPGEVALLGAGANTSFVATWIDEDGEMELRKQS